MEKLHHALETKQGLWLEWAVLKSMLVKVKYMKKANQKLAAAACDVK